jgi:mono/diheme cytochrome c family protein
MHFEFLNHLLQKTRAPFPHGLSLVVACIGMASALANAAELKDHPGVSIYRKLCADCHGNQGQGVADKYDEPLHGSRTIEALAQRIARTMPEDNVGACVGDDAKNVAAYIYDAFYSPHAQARLRPPEFDFARLTTAQYRTSVADLLGLFRPGSQPAPGDERGLRARYTGRIPVPFGPQLPRDLSDEQEARRERQERARFERIDPQVAFSFGAGSPDASRMRPDEFNIRWNGSILAPATGVHEFILRTENGARLWVNDSETALIDAWVAVGPEVREERKSIFLLGGRSYSFAVEHFKFNDKSASIQVRWKPPHGVEELIPTAQLLPRDSRIAMAVRTPFPADDRSAGFERGTSISKEWDAATTEAAIEVAEHIDQRLDELAGTKAGASDRVEKLKTFARRFAEAAFRRPLSAEEAQRAIDAPFATAKSPEIAVKRVVLLSLKSPRFLYPDPPESGPPDACGVATRLALHLWDSLPDETLRRAAAEGKLQTREQIAAQAERMVRDPRTGAKLRGFFHHWLDLERAESISKDPKAFPGFDAAVLADLRRSLELFLDEVVWSDRSDYRELLQASHLHLNDRLGKLYGKAVAGGGFQRVEFDAKERAGVVTHPYLLAAFAYSKQTSPIHRGVFLTRAIVGMTLKDPPEAVAFEDAKFGAHLTMREKVTEMTKNTNCMGCHGTINPLGFSLENYDAIGRWRTKDGGKTINPVSDFATDEGETIRLTGARDLVKFAAGNANGHRAFIHHLFHHTVKQAVGVYGPDALEELRQTFIRSGFNMRKLLAEIATAGAMRGLPESGAKIARK